ncbi:hypothetical protein L218DRAFT_1075764 [Marasmius fiardii PR-910]|nr:hypothetical protein L218DRAFT_1075764 [Marasmius fiardii PR-910]
MSTFSSQQMIRPQFLPRLVPHLYQGDQPSRPKHRALFVRTESPLAHTEHSERKDLKFCVVGTSGPLKSQSMKGRVFAPETLVAMARENEEIRRTIQLNGRSLVQLDISTLATLAMMVDSTEFPSSYYFCALVEILTCLKDRFNFPFQTELFHGWKFKQVPSLNC